ncbi:MAG: hydrogenase expression/formation protein HypE [Burkholderiaceae bacterium]
MTERVTLAQGNGGRRMRELIAQVFVTAFGAAAPDTRVDAAIVGDPGGPLVLTTDGFTVQPLEFPGGDLGALAVHGSLNDLAVAGAEPRYLTLGVILEEGFEIEVLRRLVASFAREAAAANVRLVAGDTKVVPRGHGGGAYFTVTAAGVLARPGLTPAAPRPGDRLLVSGPLGDHGVAVMLAREDFGMSGDVRSDCAPVLGLCRALWPLPGLRFTRDPTRGGLAGVTHEIATACGHGIRLVDDSIPIRDQTRVICEMLGFDALTLACEGRVIAVVACDEAPRALRRWRNLPSGRDAAIIGTIVAGASTVVLETPLGGERIIEELDDDPLPRIC